MNQLLEEIRARLRSLADQRVRASQDRFFTPEQRPQCYGVASPDVKRLAQDVYRRMKLWPVADRDRLCVALWESRMNEEGALVCYVYRRFAKTCGARISYVRALARPLRRQLGPYRRRVAVAARRVDRQ